ncbi:MAG: hypothetical protein H8E26_03910 [FCB group bacterium]|nr:hypothetical protein [FCB group bacterium]MBL7028281.1 hypothetical protein [Candidatus Neomarinimicrobiota bacterium]MBL7121600.1 hypothetical protein [Candidatus Neomarinimicrobiota bacterium]
MKFKIVVISLLIACSAGIAQNPEWINYTNGEEVYALAEAGEYIWVGTNGGLIKIDITSGEKTHVNRANSGLPSNHINSIAIDSTSGDLWFGSL